MVPDLAGPQMPSGPDVFPAAVQAEHSVSHAVSQHTLDAQWPLEQSLSAVQSSPSPHPGHEGPPQSIAVSPLLCTPSAQLGTHVVPLHSLPLQSESTLQP